MTKVSPSRSCRSISSKRVSSRSLRSSAASGSSSRSIRGRLASARASATRWRWPPDSWCGRRRPKPSSCTSAQHLADPLVDLGFRQLVLLQPEGDVAGDRKMRKQRVALEHHVDRPPVRRHAGRCPRRQAGCGPSVGVSKPASMRSSVVLPQPDGPSSAKNSRSWMSSDSRSTAAKSAEPLAHRLEPHQRARAGLGLGATPAPPGR